MSKHALLKVDLVRLANEIRGEYEDDGMTLTLRQMYYQFVARGYVPSGQDQYKRIGETLTEARYMGDFPISGLEDRGREVVQGQSIRYDVDVDDALQQASDVLPTLPRIYLAADRWAHQPVNVSVWVEKQALEGVFAPICTELGVGFFACKGYPSVSALWSWIEQMQQACDEGGASQLEVLYFGDHDPDGWEIPRSALRNINRLLDNYDVTLPKVRFTRVALNMDQIDTYSPPPFDAKVTSARYEGYVEEHNTTDAWELDALEPRVLRDLIRENVDEFFDEDICKANNREVRAARQEMIERMVDPEWARSALEGAAS